MNDRDAKLKELFWEYISALDKIIVKCEDDEMYKALITKIAMHEMNEIHDWHKHDNHEKGER